jgi:hypothetical protein
MLNLVLKEATAVPPYSIPDEHFFTAEQLIIRLGPYPDSDLLIIRPEGEWVTVSLNDRERLRARTEEL